MKIFAKIGQKLEICQCQALENLWSIEIQLINLHLCHLGSSNKSWTIEWTLAEDVFFIGSVVFAWKLRENLNIPVIAFFLTRTLPGKILENVRKNLFALPNISPRHEYDSTNYAFVSCVPKPSGVQGLDRPHRPNILYVASWHSNNNKHSNTLEKKRSKKEIEVILQKPKICCALLFDQRAKNLPTTKSASQRSWQKKVLCVLHWLTPHTQAFMLTTTKTPLADAMSWQATSATFNTSCMFSVYRDLPGRCGRRWPEWPSLIQPGT